MAALVEKVRPQFSSRDHLLCVLMAVLRVASPGCAVSSTAANEDSKTYLMERRAAEGLKVVFLS